jgi:gluconokinase
MMKIGWRDERSAALQDRIREYGLAGKPIETGFDLIDYDEGRDPVAAQAWLECPPAGDPGYRTPPGNFPSARLR